VTADGHSLDHEVSATAFRIAFHAFITLPFEPSHTNSACWTMRRCRLASTGTRNFTDLSREAKTERDLDALCVALGGEGVSFRELGLVER